MGLFDFFKKPPQIPHDSLTVWLHRKTYFEMLRYLDRIGTRSLVRVTRGCGEPAP